MHITMGYDEIKKALDAYLRGKLKITPTQTIHLNFRTLTALQTDGTLSSLSLAAEVKEKRKKKVAANG